MFPTQSGNEMSDCQSNLSRRFKQVQMNCYQTKINQLKHIFRWLRNGIESNCIKSYAYNESVYINFNFFHLSVSLCVCVTHRKTALVLC